MNEPKQEYRIRFLEKQYLNLGALFEQLEDGMMASFKQIGELFDRNFERFDAIETRLDKLGSDVSDIKKDVTSIKMTQEQILKLLQQKSGE